MPPLVIAPVGLEPLKKVEVGYTSQKNQFEVKINGEDYFKLPKEALIIDPNHIETFGCRSLKLNGDEAIRG